MRGDRGGQTLCLIERLSRMAGVQPRRIGLSATIGDPERTGAFLSQGTGRDCVIPRFENRAACGASPWSTSTTRAPRRSSGDSWVQVLKRPKCLRASASMRRHPRHCPPAPKTCVTADSSHKRSAVNVVSGHRARPLPRTAKFPRPRGEVDIPQAPEQALLNPTDTAPDNADPGMGYIFEHTRGRKCLVFANSREEAEAVCSMLRSYCESRHEPTASLSITATSRHRYARRQKSSCATRNRHRQPSPPPRWSSALISVAWSARSRSMHRLPSAPFCSAWGARDAAIFRPRCGLSCARKSPSRAR